MWARHHFLGLLIGIGALALAQPSFSDALEDCKPMLRYTGAPESIQTDNLNYLCRKGYVLAHNSKHHVPDWVLEVLTPERFEGDADRKRSKFDADPDLPPGERAELADYENSGYDRGHMAPAADMKWDQEAMNQSFYLSNMAPQVGTGFNRGIWRELEDYIRDLVNGREPIVVITGPVYQGQVKKSKKGSNVSVPSHFFKIIYEPERRRVLTFLLPNQRINAKSKTPHSLVPYVVSVRELENLTGLNFFAALPKRTQDRIETIKPLVWRVYN
jgi:endonuclease G